MFPTRQLGRNRHQLVPLCSRTPGVDSVCRVLPMKLMVWCSESVPVKTV